MTSVTALGYILAAIAFLGVLALTLPSYPGTRQAGGLIASIAISAAWAVVLAAGIFLHGGFSAWMLIVDALRSTAWILFVAGFLRMHSPARGLARTLAVAGGVLCTLAVVAVAYHGPVGSVEGQLAPLPVLGLALVGLLGLEQLYRNSVFEQRRTVRYLSIGIGIVFAIDVFVFSQALLFAQVNEALWGLRGLVVAASAPLLLLAIKQQPDWGRSVFVSRHVVFYSTSLVAAGLYLLAMAAGGALIAATGFAWGVFLQLVFFASATVVLLWALFSTSLRRRVKVFIAKHFYRNRYDYREEWLRLMQTLVGGEQAPSLPERSVRALADIIEAQHGRLWLEERDGGRFAPYGAWRVAEAGQALSGDDPLIRFMRETHWVVDTQEYRSAPERYSNALADDSPHLSEAAVFVPLIHAGMLIGIVGLDRPPGLGPLTYEDHDLLKTAGQQVAIFLQQERAQEALSETRQFEAFARLTAFLMHDLKNLIAQQELVVRNAQRFKHRPEFIEDAVTTIESGVRRMRRVLERLQSAAKPEQRSLVDVIGAAQEACRTCADRVPKPALQISAPVAKVAADRERLCMAITHAIRNAQDATPPDGRVTVSLADDGERVRVEVRDTGSGMDSEFIRNELFKPFHSTKGAKGMGIGAYQIRETIQGAGGDVEIVSEIGVGTTLCMWLPAAAEHAKAGQSAA